MILSLSRSIFSHLWRSLYLGSLTKEAPIATTYSVFAYLFELWQRVRVSNLQYLAIFLERSTWESTYPSASRVHPHRLFAGTQEPLGKHLVCDTSGVVMRNFLGCFYLSTIYMIFWKGIRIKGFPSQMKISRDNLSVSKHSVRYNQSYQKVCSLIQMNPGRLAST